MRWLPLFILTLLGTVLAGEQSSPTYPLWDGHESVADYAKKVNLPATQSLDLGGGVKLELVLIPAGHFIMGTAECEKPLIGQLMVGISGGIIVAVVACLLLRARWERKRPQFSMALMLFVAVIAGVGIWGGVRWRESLKHLDDYLNEHPAHLVIFTQPIYMGKYAVTQRQYLAVEDANPSDFLGMDRPVESVSWEAAMAFCKKVTEKTKLQVGLPTEAEWEFACRGGTTTAFYSGDTEADLARAAWYFNNSKESTHPVGQKEPNAFGLYDMHGNVWQFCADWYADDYYAKSTVENPHGPVGGIDRVLRGGSWYVPPMGCRSALRGRRLPGDEQDDSCCGFRVVVEPAFNAP